MIIGLIDLCDDVGRLVAKVEDVGEAALVVGAEVQIDYRDTPDGFAVFFARLSQDRDR
jgi:hypothetical protein